MVWIRRSADGALRCMTQKRGCCVFKNMIVYRIAAQWQGALEQMEEALQKTPFTPVERRRKSLPAGCHRVARSMACWPKAWAANG
jgi:hypothetical protein